MLAGKKLVFLLCVFICLTAFTCPGGHGGNSGSDLGTGGEKENSDKSSGWGFKFGKMTHADSMRIEAENNHHIDSTTAIKDTAVLKYAAEGWRQSHKFDSLYNSASTDFPPSDSDYKKKKQNIGTYYCDSALVYMLQEADSTHSKREQIAAKLIGIKKVPSGLADTLNPATGIVLHIEDSLKNAEKRKFYAINGFRLMTVAEVEAIANAVVSKLWDMLHPLRIKSNEIVENGLAELSVLKSEYNEVKREEEFIDWNLEIHKYERKIFDGTYFGLGSWELTETQIKTISDAISTFVDSFNVYIGETAKKHKTALNDVHPTVCVRIFTSGYTDDMPCSMGNDKLSYLRADTVADIADLAFHQKIKQKSQYDIQYIFPRPSVRGHGTKIPLYPVEMGPIIFLKGINKPVPDPNRRVVFLQCVFMPDFKCN